MDNFNLSQSDAEVQSLLNAIPGKATKTEVQTAMNAKITYSKANRKLTINTTSL